MKLWILRAIDGLPDDNNPWHPWYDCTFGMVIRADTEKQARQKAQDEGSPETEYWPEAWTSHKLSTCRELLPDGDEDIIIEDSHWA